MDESMKLVFDVGMHKGEDTDYYLKKGFRVVSFEADPDLAELCRKRFSEQLKTGQLHIVEGAIVDLEKHQSSDGKIRFFKNKKSSVWGTVVDDWAERNTKLGSDSEIIEVAIIDFAACIRQYGMPYYLKIDIEGMDVICLKALRGFTERPAYISIESEKISFDKLSEEFRIFTELGYDAFQTVNQIKVTDQKEPKNTTEGNYLGYRFSKGSSGLFGTDLNKSDWKSLDQSLKRYKEIFNGYKYLGDDGKFTKFLLGRLFSKATNRLFGIPGWYDTHARHSSVK